MMKIDEPITAEQIEIGDWTDDGETYRAAYVGQCVLTGPEHAGLGDDDLVAEALAEVERAGNGSTVVTISHCGNCGEYHREDCGDCRDDSQRFTDAGDAERRLGVTVVEAPCDCPDCYHPTAAGVTTIRIEGGTVVESERGLVELRCAVEEEVD